MTKEEDEMKIKQCRSCKYVKLPKYHSGYTGKRGPETWWHCALVNVPLRYILTCTGKGKEKVMKTSIDIRKYQNIPPPVG